VIHQEIKRKTSGGPEDGGHFRVEMNPHFTSYLVIENSELCWASIPEVAGTKVSQASGEGPYATAVACGTDDSGTVSFHDREARRSRHRHSV